MIKQPEKKVNSILSRVESFIKLNLQQYNLLIIINYYKIIIKIKIDHIISTVPCVTVKILESISGQT